MARAGLIAAVAIVALGLVSIARSGEPAPGVAPPCFGAAARDAAHPCVNPSLRTLVTPAPRDALLVPDAPCDPVAYDAVLDVCVFGAPSGSAATVALLGDSHASGWRAALIAAGWAGVSLTRSSCPFSRARPRVDARSRTACRRWNDAAIAWLGAHPRVRHVFVSALAGAPILPEAGRTGLESKVDGYRAAWAALPPSVKRIFVLRDVPTHPWRTIDCLEAALAAHRPPMPLCSVRRSGALLADPEVLAARRTSARRVRVIDLTSFMCGPRRCYPVVGGVLVNKDTNHLSRAFSTTLGPYVYRRARPWPAP